MYETKNEGNQDLIDHSTFFHSVKKGMGMALYKFLYYYYYYGHFYFKLFDVLLVITLRGITLG